MIFLYVILSGYILGSIPSAVWIGKLFHGIDIREHGSKNAGATNTFRVIGNGSGIIVLILCFNNLSLTSAGLLILITAR